ncbi:hypothetical protein BDQ17DRAFT_1336938 [Cyathus striatus]|nr:hypothetical protein BDQ17DRAFT_1336938 [Cyathus striatus]
MNSPGTLDGVNLQARGGLTVIEVGGKGEEARGKRLGSQHQENQLGMGMSPWDRALEMLRRLGIYTAWSARPVRARMLKIYFNTAFVLQLREWPELVTATTPWLSERMRKDPPMWTVGSITQRSGPTRTSGAYFHTACPTIADRLVLGRGGGGS